jgi:chemotaxis protein methyltransferase CheR
MDLSKQEFNLLSDYIYSLSGIALREGKAYLMRQRLEPVAVRLGCKSFLEFYQRIQENSVPRIEEEVINAITTNETSFFRDGHPFVAFEKHVLPWLGENIRERKSRRNPRKGPKVALWSAGASTGQEAYTLAMLIREYAEANRYLGLSKEDFGLLATDVSSQALSKAVMGEYTDVEIRRGLSPKRVEKYFTKAGNRWVIKNRMRIMLEFRQVNLSRPFTMLGGFDVIVCRNVLIYFDSQMKSRVIQQFYDMLSDGGFLILGVTENLHAVADRTDGFQPVRHGKTLLYRKSSTRPA